MGKDFFENFKASALVFEEASDACKLNLKKLCFEGPIEKLTETSSLQPALVATEAAMLAALKSESMLEVSFAAGHSLGEYVALLSSGILTTEAAVRLTAARGAAMQAATPPGTGSMAAILGLNDETTIALCETATRDCIDFGRETVEAANFNAPGQVVIAGHSRAVQAAIDLTKSDTRFQKAKAIPLQVSAPFHCALMQPARDLMEPLLESAFQAARSVMQFPVLANINAQPHAHTDVWPKLLSEQITKPVLWARSMKTLRELGVERLLEIGPGKVLAGLQKRIDREVEVVNIGTVADLKSFLTGTNK